MRIKVLLILLMLVSTTAAVLAQETLKTFTLSPTFSITPGSPRVTRNAFKHLWLVTWRQGNPGRIIGRVVTSEGTLGGQKVLASGVTTAEQNFDVSYDSINYTYVLAFENTKGLHVQFFNKDLVRQGSSNLIEADVSNTNPRLAYDPSGKTFLIFWLGTQDGVPHRMLKNRILDSAGKPTGDSRILATAPSGKTLASLNISANQKNGNLIAQVMEMTQTSGSLLGYLVKPDGALLRSTPLRFQPLTTGLNSSADASFADSGSGFSLWSDSAAIKYRKISASGSFASGTKTIPGAADTNSVQTSIVLDSRNSQFVGLWTRANQVQAASLNLTSGALLKKAVPGGNFASIQLQECNGIL